MEMVEELRRKLREAEERERIAKAQCTACDGKGWICDTTYDRAGVSMPCGRCHASCLPKDQVDRIIADAFAPFRKPKGS